MPGRPEPPANAELIKEAGLEPGPGAPLPPVEHAGPHWLGAACPTEEKNGPWIAVIWDRDDPAGAGALERFSRRAVRVYSWTGLPAEKILRSQPTLRGAADLGGGRAGRQPAGAVASSLAATVGRMRWWSGPAAR
ncbi:MAG: hypothetical protein R2748_10715 [Bryobacterales bacterium]